MADGSTATDTAAAAAMDKMTAAMEKMTTQLTEKIRKIAILESFVMNQLLHNLHSLCLNAAEKRKLDAFQVRCLRRILKIPPSFYSNMTNQIKLELVNCKIASTMIFQHQMT